MLCRAEGLPSHRRVWLLTLPSLPQPLATHLQGAAADFCHQAEEVDGVGGVMQTELQAPQHLALHAQEVLPAERVLGHEAELGWLQGRQRSAVEGQGAGKGFRGVQGLESSLPPKPTLG